MVFELKHDILWMHFFSMFHQKTWPVWGCCTSEVVSVLTSKQPVRTFNALDVSCWIKHVLVSRLWCYCTSAPISMELQQYKTWQPICLHNLSVFDWRGVVWVQTRKEGGYIMIFLEQGEEKSSFMGLRSTTLCFKYSRGFYLLCG